MFYSLIFRFASAMPLVLIGCLDSVWSGFSFDNAIKRIADFGYAAIPLALMGHLAFYWDKLKVSFWRLLEITNIYKSSTIESEVLIANKIGGISALELLFILAGFIGNIYVFYIISKKTRHILTKSTIVCYFTVFTAFAFLYICIL